MGVRGEKVGREGERVGSGWEREGVREESRE